MNPIYVAPPQIHPSQLPQQPAEVTDLLRQLVDLQKQQLDFSRTILANADERARWVAFYGRWSNEFPDLPASSKKVLPIVEKAFLGMLRDVCDRALDEDQEGLHNEFALADFLDRFGPRLQQLGGILGQIGHLSNLAPAE